MNLSEFSSFQSSRVHLL